MRDPSGGCGLIFLSGGGGGVVWLGAEGTLKLRVDLLHEKVTGVLVIMCPSGYGHRQFCWTGNFIFENRKNAALKTR